MGDIQKFNESNSSKKLPNFVIFKPPMAR